MSIRPPLAAALATLLFACTGPSACASADTLATRGVERAREGDLDGALASFQASLRKDPENLKALYNTGLAWMLEGHGPNAVEALESFVRLRPDDMLGHFDLARAWAISGRRANALASLRKAVDMGFADHALLVRGGGFQAIYGDPQFIALEMVVAQRGGVLADGGSLGNVQNVAYGGTPVDITLPGISTRSQPAACGADAR